MRQVGDLPQQYRSLHALNRLGFGPRPGDIERISAIGIDRYLEQQLHPESIPIQQGLVTRIASYRTLQMTPMALFREFQLPIRKARQENQGSDKEFLRAAIKDERLRQRVVMREAAEARLVRAIEGPRQLQEVMTAFWFNHFNVFAGKGLDYIWTGSFEETAIRPNTMGKFRALLGATARHPAMLFYLDNWQNTAPRSPGAKGKFEGINENYARELMELHTMGVNGGYTQQDVVALAHVLTGWGFPRGRDERPRSGPRNAGAFGLFGPVRPRRLGPGEPRVPPNPSFFYFDADRHDFSEKLFLGQRIRGSGIEEGDHALDILARHPATARHLSYQLSQYFVSDTPPDALVQRAAQRYLRTDGDIREVLTTIFTSPEFWDRRSYSAKFKSPYEYVVSCIRASAVQVSNYRPIYGTMQLLGMSLYGCQTPNGFANTQDAWLNPDAMMTRVSFATALGSGSLPLDRPPFDEGEDLRPVVARRSGAHTAAKIEYDPNKRNHMTPPVATKLIETLGGTFSESTSAAIEAAPIRLRAALVLGSPEFMMR